VTARTTTLKGADAGRYYVEDQLGYYLDRGEPPGRWMGRGAEHLGLAGEVDEDAFLDLMAGIDPGRGELLGTRHTERTVRGYDVTCSAPKSVSVLWAVGDDPVREQVLAGHDAAVNGVVDWIDSHAHCRYRVAGDVRVFDAEGVVAALFRQHTSRALDPQLHTHAVIVNRVLAPDGRWLALDARTIKRDQRSLSALYHAGLRTELTQRLGVRWREPANGIAEIAGVPDDVLAEFSQRSEAVEARIEEKLERFSETFERDPTPRERWTLEREAVLDSRPAKTESDPASLEREWLGRLAGLDLTPERLVAGAVEVEAGIHHLDRAAEADLVERALVSLAERQSTWRVAELVRELAAAVPTSLAVPAAELAPWLDRVADQVVATRMVDLSRPVADGVELRIDGRPVTEGAVDRVLTLPAVLAEEERVVTLAERRTAAGGDDHAVTATEELDAPQQALAEAVAGERALVLAVGPAGTGKTSALRPAVDQLRREGRAVFGVAPSAAAAEVLGSDAGVDADTIDKLLVEHTLDRPPDHRYALPAGATVIVDEAAMVATPRLAELVDLADRHGWRLALVGDPLQFSAVGRSGMFGHLVDTFGAIELGRVHRFHHEWEREASLRLRRGDTSVIDLYEQHGRLHGGTPRQMRRAVVERWWRAVENGETASMMAPSNEAVVALNRAAQWRRLEAGQLDPEGPSLEVGQYRLHPGDLVATRQNDRKLVTDRHLMVKNRDRWTVEAVHRDGSLFVAGRTGRVRLPAAYVASQVELAYAETSHANQGRTVDRSFLYLDGPTGASGVYVPLTRGRESNDAYVAIQGLQTPADVLAEALSRTWVDRPAVAVRAELRAEPAGDGSGQLLDGAELRRLMERSAEIGRSLASARYEPDAQQKRLDRLTAGRQAMAQSIAQHEAQLDQARRILAEHDHPLVWRLHRADVESARAGIKWLPGAIKGDRAKLSATDAQIAQVERNLERAARLADQKPELLAERAMISVQLEGDLRARGVSAAAEPAVVETLGPKPAGGAAEALWCDAAAHVSQHEAAFGHSGGRSRGWPNVGLGDDAYASSQKAMRDAIERLDRSLGRGPEIEPPHRSLGLSL